MRLMRLLRDRRQQRQVAKNLRAAERHTPGRATLNDALMLLERWPDINDIEKYHGDIFLHAFGLAAYLELRSQKMEKAK